METISAGKPLRGFVKLCRAADRPVLLVGGAGVGKSESLREAAAEMNIQCTVRDLSLMEPTDLAGLPRAKGGATTYSPPAFLPQGGAGLFVLEELNRAERYMQAPALELLTSRRLNDYTLPRGWLPCAAINPAGDDYQVNDLDPALLSRFVQVRVVPDPKEWLSWARSSLVHPHVLAYVEADESVFDSAESNPRAWKYVSDIMNAADEQGASPATVRAAVLGLVGDVRGKAFLASIKKVERALEAIEVFQSYGKHRVQFRRWIDGGRLDLVQATVRGIQVHLQPQDDYAAVRQDHAQWGNLGWLLWDLPGDMREELQAWLRERGYDRPPRPPRPDPSRFVRLQLTP